MRLAIGKNGFHLSQDALHRLIELGWNTSTSDKNAIVKDVVEDDPDWLYCNFDCDIECRSDPRLLKVIDELGSKAAGRSFPTHQWKCSEIIIRTIPDDVKVEITLLDPEYDLVESIVEVHRTWGFPYSTCTICGLTDKHELSECGFHDVCSCCGTEVGFDDGITSQEEMRQKWIDGGMKWHSTKTPPPSNWSPNEQLKTIGVYVD